MDHLNVLYSQDINGKMKEWKIQVLDKGDHSIMEYSYGYTGGKMISCSQKYSKGKNIGKSNETTHYTQATSDAKSKLKKKLDQGYYTHIDSSVSLHNNLENLQLNPTASSDIKQDTTVFPMLAQDFSKRKSKISYPVFIQPKLDGYRMIYNSLTKYCNSRQGKEFEILKETDLYKELINITDNITLDGELYIHNGIFENLGILRKKKLKNNDLLILNQIEYHVYDIIDEQKPYQTRYNTLQELFNNNTFLKIKLVNTLSADSEQDLTNKHINFVNDNYEGSIVRTISGKYKCKARSLDLLKYKDFDDAEFKIVGFTSEKDTSKKDDDLIVWICKTIEDNTFNVRPKGTKEERQMLYKRGQDFIGRNLHVKYFELTESKVPRFPTTKSETYSSYIRDIIE